MLITNLNSLKLWMKSISIFPSSDRIFTYSRENYMNRFGYLDSSSQTVVKLNQNASLISDNLRRSNYCNVQSQYSGSNKWDTCERNPLFSLSPLSFNSLPVHSPDWMTLKIFTKRIHYSEETNNKIGL